MNKLLDDYDSKSAIACMTNSNSVLRKYSNILYELIRSSSKSIKEYGIINFARANVNLLKHVDFRDLLTLSRSYALYAANKNTNMPTYSNIELTYDCSRRCVGCYIPDVTRKNTYIISDKLLGYTVEKLVQNNISYFGLTGGEPLSKQTMPLIYDLAKKYPSTLFSVYTNGDYLAMNGLCGLEKLHNIIYAVSINGITKHDDIRGKGSLENVLKSFDILHDNRKFFGAGITLSKENIDEATSPQMIELLVKHKALYAHFIKVRSENELININYDIFNNAISKIGAYKKKYPIMLLFGIGKNGQGTSSMLSYSYLTINPSGDIRILRTDMDDAPIGNILDKDVDEILKNFKIKQSEKEYR